MIKTPLSSSSRSENPAEVEVDILGERLKLRASEDPSLVSEVAEIVRCRLHEANRRLSGSPNKNRVLLLALIDLAEEYVKAKQRTVAHRMKVNAKLSEVRASLQRAQGKVDLSVPAEGGDDSL
ncbi:MAG: Cell division protein ZapA [Pseudomonadota bacterium]|jgi:cell division protein ZapA (FtsZ GTPase activity inhibitor)